ncbi:MAG TPA: isoleucine--tRNA ligase [Vicinamibacterales bacterium]|nr:isoleucine--tRNA ligase [Vicinamibacterales bacterium]
MRDWKDTLNLPRTEFPMRANLPVTEPQVLARWEALGLERRLAERGRRLGRRFVLHDGPPYANGRLHIGTAFNKILKDFVVRSRRMSGYDAPYVPGWDCHGLPIELNVDRELGAAKREMSVVEFRRACARYAERFVELQRQDFRRLGVAGSWDAPYLTMDRRYQAAIVRALGRFVAKGLVYKGRKPVHWCIHCRTALAEAEVEYGPHVSPSIYVEFPLAPDDAARFAALVPAAAGRAVSVLVWTTTPWTIPANLAVAFHPDLAYAACASDGAVVLVAEALVPEVAARTGRALRPLASVPGRALEGLRFRHPLYDRDSLAILGEHVTTAQGTGAVHTAPGHGADDFAVGARYGLEAYAPVGPDGHFEAGLPLFGGQRVFDANPHIEAALAARGRLWHRETIEHAYPHCWRCHNPVIFLATWQWFIAMDQPVAGGRTLRDQAMDAAAGVDWNPAWGADRMRAMFAARPDWCISRQRAWGVPIPALICTACGEAVLTEALAERAAAVFEVHGADAWYERPLAEFLPEGMRCPACGGAAFERERDILDVWFDSGSSHFAVLEQRPELGWPADLYLEGQDQYRGWFQSSLLVGLGTRGGAPYRQVLTHGFVVDEQGRKMSKSLGNVVSPLEVIERSGAEVLRLWVAMVEFREEVRLGPEVLARVAEAYRKIRNTFRYLVSNLYDFEPARDALPAGELEELDRYALARYAEAGRRVLRAYERFEFQSVFQTLNLLLTVDLSAFYLDVSKDRLYTLAPRSRARRSAQTAIYRIADGLARLAAPILPVTSDEVWQHLPGRREESVHLAVFPDDLDALVDAELLERWTALLELRDRVNAALEAARQQKIIGTSLGARVELRAAGAQAVLLERYRDVLPTLFIVSEVEIVRDEEAATLGVTVRRADGVRCPRCWRVVPGLVAAADGELCARCVEALAQAVA